MPKKIFVLTCLVLMLAVQFAIAGTTGKIAGRVVDKNNGEPLIGANIIVEGTSLGAQSDLSGEFFILNVPPGNYTVSAIYVGYKTQQITNVTIKVDLTTGLDFDLEESIIEGETVVVVSERPLIQKDATATAAVVTAAELEVSPIENFNDIAQTKAGINVGPDGSLHFRGGRASEVAYIVDGVTVTDAFDGGISVGVSTNAIEELSIITGAFNAEYGQAMSGIVNIVTKEGARDYTGRVSFQAGDVATNANNIFLDEINTIDMFNTTETEVNLSGPVPFTNNNVTFNISGRMYDDGGYLYGERWHSPTDVADSIRTGDGAFVSLNPETQYNVHGKLKFHLNDRMNFYFSTIYENREYQVYDHQSSKVPDGFATRYSTGTQFIGKFNHNISSRSFYTFAMAYVSNEYNRYLDEDPFSDKYVWGGYQVTSAGQQFYTGGTDNFRQKRTQETVNAIYNFTSQLSKSHELKAGFELKRHTLYNHSYYMDPDKRAEPFVDSNSNGVYDAGESFTDVDRDGTWSPAEDNNNNGIAGDIIELAGYTNDEYERNPMELSAYIQDKIELEDMVINVGLRLDYFDPDGRALTDPTDPDITNPVKNSNLWKDYGTDGIPNTNDADGSENNGVRDPGEAEVTLAERESYWYKDVDPTIQLSPRISFAFPISTSGKLFFSYGHFFQLPPYEYLYTHFEGRVKPGLIETDMGNPELKPQKTVSYEVGVEQELMEDLALYVKLYQRDITNILGQDIVVLPNTDSYALYVNRDYGRVRGVNLTLQKRFSNTFSASVDYTYQVAEGNESNPAETRRNFRLNLEELKKIVPLDWDQTHTLRLNTTVGKPRDWNVSLLGRIESGYPYTPQSANEIIQLAEKNSGRKIPIIKFDLRARKSFEVNVSNQTYLLSLYAKVYNLFDRLNENYVWDATGRATYGLGLYGAVFDPEWQRRPHWFYKPREIFVGMELEF
jgi:outer membrane receptor for ferrienterochelin and colicin